MLAVHWLRDFSRHSIFWEDGLSLGIFMPLALDFFIHYGYVVLFVWVLAEQLGMPIPSAPLLITAGTLTATHKLNLALAVLAVLMREPDQRHDLVPTGQAFWGPGGTHGLPALDGVVDLRSPHRGLLHQAWAERVAAGQVYPRPGYSGGADRRADEHEIPDISSPMIRAAFCCGAWDICWWAGSLAMC